MNWLHSMLSDGCDGSLSSRRVVTFSAFLLCAIAFIANLFFGMKMEQFIFDSMSYIAMAGLGATVAEKFAGKKTYDYNNYNQYNEYPPPRNMRNYTPFPQRNDPQI